MKNILVMGCVGVGLFSATVAALLGAQGRLNYEGTRHIPLLSAFFDGSAGEEAPTTPVSPGSRSKKGIPEPRNVTGSSGAGPGSDVLEKMAAGVTEELAQPGRDDSSTGALRTAVPAGIGNLFDLRHVEKSGLTVEEVNSIIGRARGLQLELQRERTELNAQRKDLETRERDIENRQEKVMRLVQEVREERTRVEKLIDDFNEQVAVIAKHEEAALRKAAATIAKLTPHAGAELVMEFWREKSGQQRVVKLLAVMDVDRADEIIGSLETELLREILERRMLVVRQGQQSRRSR